MFLVFFFWCLTANRDMPILSIISNINNINPFFSSYKHIIINYLINLKMLKVLGLNDGNNVNVWFI